MSDGETNSGNGVRITNREIYDLLVRVDSRVGRVEQNLEKVVEPTLTRHDEALKHKAEKTDVAAVSGRTEKLEMRVYAVLAGLIAAVLGLNGMGVI